MADRSGLSNNWRVRSDVLPQVDNPTAKSPVCQRRWGPQRDATSSLGERQGQNTEAESSKIRGEDDPRTLQAIAEGRRLYVGNMPYMAKTRDVEALFADVSYQVYACSRWSVHYTDADHEGSTLTCPLILLPDGILHTVRRQANRG